MQKRLLAAVLSCAMLLSVAGTALTANANMTTVKESTAISEVQQSKQDWNSYYDVYGFVNNT